MRLRRPSKPILRSKSQPFIGRRQPNDPTPTTPPRTPRQKRKSLCMPPASAPRLNPELRDIPPCNISETPVKYTPTKSRAFVRVKVSDFVLMPADRLADAPDVLGPVDTMCRPPCYDLTPGLHPDVPDASPPRTRDTPSAQRHTTARADSFTDIGVQVNEISAFDDNGAQVHVSCLRAGSERSGETFIINDCDRVSRLVDIVTAKPADLHALRVSSNTLASQIAAGKVVRRQISQPPKQVQPHEKPHHTQANTRALHQPSVSPTSTLLSTFSVNTSVSDLHLSEDASNIATQDSASDVHSHLCTTPSFQPSLADQIPSRVVSDVNSEAFSEAHPILLQPPDQFDKFADATATNSSDEIAASSVDRALDEEESMFNDSMLDDSTQNLEVPSTHVLFTKVQSAQTISSNAPTPDSRENRKSLPSFWQKKTPSPVKYTFRPLHKQVQKGSEDESKASSQANRSDSPRYLPRAHGRRLTPIPTVPSPPDGVVATMSPTTPAIGSKGNGAALLPPMIESVVKSPEAKAILEAASIPAITLAPTKMFRKSWIKRPSNESNTSSTTEYYEDDYTKFIEKKSTSPLRLLPHPSFARLIGSDGRALRSSKLDCRTNSTISLSTSDEEYRPFDGGNG